MHLEILSTLSCLTSGLHCDVVHLVGLSSIDACTASCAAEVVGEPCCITLRPHSVTTHSWQVLGRDSLKSAPKQQLSGHFEQDL